MLLDVLDAIFRYKVKAPALLEDFAKIITTSEKFQAERNTYVHSYYDIDSWGGKEISFTRKNIKIRRGRGHDLLFIKHDPELLGQSARNIYGLIVNIFDFADKLKKENIITDVYDTLD